MTLGSFDNVSARPRIDGRSMVERDTAQTDTMR
jgi:hypothetical protein